MNRDTTHLFAYHKATRHTPQQLRESGHTLDWANMPDPFRHYEQVPVHDLRADPPAPAIDTLAVLRGEPAPLRIADGAAFLSSLLFHAAAISASKRSPSGTRYALRVNPSSGNLHPTEFHFAAAGLPNWDDGLYHYRASSHMAEQRARGDGRRRLLPGTGAPLVLVLTSIAWREAWKYQDRAYRYCLLDIGHAWQAIALAAHALGAEARASGHFADANLQAALGVEDEWPLLLITISGPGVPCRANPHPEPWAWQGGEPNRLSDAIVPYPLIEAIHRASCIGHDPPPSVPPGKPPTPGPSLPPAVMAGAPFATVVRRRRSALDFYGDQSISLPQFTTLLDAATTPLQADFAGEPLTTLYAYVHHVTGLAPGLYRHERHQRALTPLKPGNQRVMAAALSLRQSLAGNACVAFSIVADLERAGRHFGNRGYRYAHFEAGAVGHRLYLAADGMGFQSTGIGAFFDDEVHAYLNLSPAQGQVIYHFACGHAIPDDRLTE